MIQGEAPQIKIQGPKPKTQQAHPNPAPNPHQPTTQVTLSLHYVDGLDVGVVGLVSLIFCLLSSACSTCVPNT